MPTEYPSQVFYPAARLQLIFRLEEFGQNKNLMVPKAPVKSTKVLNGVKDDRAPLVATADPNSPPGTTRFLLTSKGATPGVVPADQTASADGFTHETSIIPRNATWDQKGLREGDTLSAEFRFLDCPLDPRIIRACAVRFYLGAWSPEQFSTNVQGGYVAAAGDNKRRPMPMLPVADPKTGNSFLRFDGWVDKWTVDWPDGGEPSVKVECRDNTSLLINQEASMLLVLDMTKRLDEAVAQYLSHYPQMAGLTVEYLPEGVRIPVLKDALSDTAHRPTLGPQPSKSGGSDSRLMVWDYLTDVVGSVGHVIRVSGTRIIIQTARSYTTGKIVRRPEDPFQGRTLPGGETLSYRRFLYGRNVLDMKVSRHFGRKAPFGVECRCYDSENKKVLVARFPKDGKRTADTLVPGDGVPDHKWAVIRVAGIRDVAVLEHVAQGYYEQVGRNEVEIEVKTKNLASFGGGNADPDLLDAKAGDTIEILTNREAVGGAPGGNSLTMLEQILTSQGRAEEFLKVLGLSDEAAAAVAKAYANAGFLTQFRIRTMSVKWDVDDAVEISATCVNYVEVRADIDGDQEPAGEKASPGKQPKASVEP